MCIYIYNTYISYIKISKRNRSDFFKNMKYITIYVAILSHPKRAMPIII